MKLRKRSNISRLVAPSIPLEKSRDFFPVVWKTYGTMRYLSETIDKFASEKFVLMPGPRQVGKTTLAKHWLEKKNGLYLNWDIDEDRKKIITKSFLDPLKKEAIVLDEIHKYRLWKSWVKGLYDQFANRVDVLVTGSARLDIFQKGGDSLLGRHEYLRLHPFSIGELEHGKLLSPPDDFLNLEARKVSAKTWEQLARVSGFPEPFFKDEQAHYNRWSRRRRDLLIQQDIRTLTEIKYLELVEHLAIILPLRVGSTLSVNSLRTELQVAHDTANSWLDALERVYFFFRIGTYTKKISRSLKKEEKIYLWDWSSVDEPASRFENMVASHLLKSCHAWTDVGFGEYNLFYLRTKEKEEVDFVLTNKNKPIALFECKLSETSLSPTLLKYGKILGNIPQIQLVNVPNVDRIKNNARVVSADSYLANLV